MSIHQKMNDLPPLSTPQLSYEEYVDTLIKRIVTACTNKANVDFIGGHSTSKTLWYRDKCGGTCTHISAAMKYENEHGKSVNWIPLTMSQATTILDKLSLIFPSVHLVHALSHDNKEAFEFKIFKEKPKTYNCFCCLLY